MPPPPLVDRLGGASSQPAPPAPGTAPPVALVAFHGMGQQVRYGTLEETVAVLERGAKAAGGTVQLTARRQHHDGDRLVGCAELELRLEGRPVQPVHVYEAYWAPLTEGRITAWQTFTFLFWAASDGARSGRTFERFLFQAPAGEPFTAPPIANWGLLLVALFLAALGAFDAVVVAAIASGILAGGEPHWFHNLSYLLLSDFAAALLIFAAMFVGVGVPWLLRHLVSARTRQPFCRAANLGLRMAAVLFALVGIDLLLTCLLGVGRGTDHGPSHSLVTGLLGRAWITHMQSMAQSRGWVIAFGTIVALLAYKAGEFIRDYVGDVAVYISSHRLDRFNETRIAIQQVATDLLHFVYTRAGDDDTPAYQRVVLMGHSLGSVVAYDGLNRLLLDDEASGGVLGIAARTTALITYGSPLDKIAFVFRTQRALKDGTFREAMAASRQPLIEDPVARRLWWINVFSRLDWIGGDLDFYDSQQPQAVRPVINLEDCDATTPLAAHGEHTRGALLPSVVTSAVTNTLGLNEAVVTGLKCEQKLRTLPVGSRERRDARRRC